MKLKKAAFFLGTILLFAGCKPKINIYTSTSSEPGDELNPCISSTASVSQDYIFNTESVGQTRITIRRSQWNKMLEYYDYFYKNENSVIAESYEYVKDGKKWKINKVGLRLRGNTSRFRPQGKDYPTDETGHTKMNQSWSQSYYDYAKDCDDNDYRQSHFKVDFEPFDGDDKKLSDCMKGVALKRSDSYFSKEIMCYYLFHKFGIWTAPRASQTKVLIDFIEDLNSDGTVKEEVQGSVVTTVDFGVYEMFEEVNKQSLKGRAAKKANNKASNAWQNNEGDLWKCSGGDLTSSSNKDSNFGVEDIRIINADLSKDRWDFIWSGPCYDLKTNKAKVDTAKVKFQGFISELNALSDIPAGTKDGIQARKDFYEKWFDVDFFIKTYAVNVLVGMDDDYWANANNYYLYFDNGKNGSGKCYFIPFDYDNSLGGFIDGNLNKKNPLAWGTKASGQKCNRPLMDRLLEVPEYLEKYKQTLLEVSSQDDNSPWNKDNCFAVMNRWRDQVSSYTATKDIKGWPNIGCTAWNEGQEWWASLTTNNGNFYEAVTNRFKKVLEREAPELSFDLNGGSFDGESGVVTRKYYGLSSDLNDILGVPERSGYMFIGWTKTKDGTDYLSKYEKGEDVVYYASWKDIASAGSDLLIFEIKDDNFKGIKIGIANLPETHYRRTFYVNGKEVGGEDKSSSKYQNIWAYPFVEEGKTYTVKVSYSNEGYGWLANSNELSVTASSGTGEFKVTNTPSFRIVNNVLRWDSEPEIQIGDKKIREDDNWDEYYLLELQSTKKKDDYSAQGFHDSWKYQTWNYLGSSCNKGFDFLSNIKGNQNKTECQEVLDGVRFDLCFKLKYVYNSLPYGNYSLTIIDYNDMEKFNLSGI